MIPWGPWARAYSAPGDAFRSAGVKDVTLKLYPGLRHEILNEKVMQKTVYSDIHDWLSRYV